MSIVEEFLTENEDICKNANQFMERYSEWLKKKYADCPSEEGKILLQKEADRMSDIYIECLKKIIN